MAERNTFDAISGCLAIKKFDPVTYSQKRRQQTAAKLERQNVKEKNPKAKSSQSFCFNVFKGDLVVDQVFPYPEILSAEQKAQLCDMIDPDNVFW